MKRKKRNLTPEERAAERARRDELTQRLQERMEYWRARVAAANARHDTA